MWEKKNQGKWKVEKKLNNVLKRQDDTVICSCELCRKTCRNRVWHRSMFMDRQNPVIQHMFIHALVCVCGCASTWVWCYCGQKTAVEKGSKHSENTHIRVRKHHRQQPGTKCGLQQTHLIAAQRISTKQTETRGNREIRAVVPKGEPNRMNAWWKKGTWKSKTKSKAHKQTRLFLSSLMHLWVYVHLYMESGECEWIFGHDKICSVPTGRHYAPALCWLRSLGKSLQVTNWLGERTKATKGKRRAKKCSGA